MLLSAVMCAKPLRHRNVNKFEIKTQDWILSKNTNPGIVLLLKKIQDLVSMNFLVNNMKY